MDTIHQVGQAGLAADIPSKSLITTDTEATEAIIQVMFQLLFIFSEKIFLFCIFPNYIKSNFV